jgi:8-oxo-dGTP pyrophosphatase MutT (NUDIX family)
MEIENIKIGVACALIRSDLKQIWLSQRLGSYQRGKYAFPGGMVESTDISDLHAIQREVFEETGIYIENLNRFKRSIVSRHPGGKSDVTHWFLLELTESFAEIPKNTEPTKHGNWKLYNLMDVKSLPLMMSTGEILTTLSTL